MMLSINGLRLNLTIRELTTNYQDVQPVNVVYGRYLNEGDILGRRKNVVMDTKSAQMLFGTENAVGRSFRTTFIWFYPTTLRVVGVYRQGTTPFQALMMGNSDDKGSAFIPYTLLTWPNDYFTSSMCMQRTM